MRQTCTSAPNRHTQVCLGSAQAPCCTLRSFSEECQAPHHRKGWCTRDWKRPLVLWSPLQRRYIAHGWLCSGLCLPRLGALRQDTAYRTVHPVGSGRCQCHSWSTPWLESRSPFQRCPLFRQDMACRRIVRLGLGSFQRRSWSMHWLESCDPFRTCPLFRQDMACRRLRLERLRKRPFCTVSSCRR